MDQVLLFALLGVGVGAVYAGLGMGLVTVHKGSGVINFAQASLGLWGAFTFDELHRSGDLVLPVVGVSGVLHLGTSTPMAAAVVIGVLSSAVLGVLAHLLVFRPLRHAPVLAKILGAIGILTIVQSVLLRQFGAPSRVVDAVFPQRSIPLAGLSFPEDRLWLLGTVLVSAALLWAYYRWSLVGLATRAGVEDEVALALSRWSPEKLAALNWAIGAGVSGLFFILASPITGLNPASVGLLVVPGLASMLVARLTSVVWAAVAGMVLGMFQSELSLAQLQDWWPRNLPSGTTDAVPFLVVVIALVALGDRLPTRGSLVLTRLPEVVRNGLRPRTLIAGAVVVGLLAPLLGYEQRTALISSMVFSVLALSFVVLVGLVGQVSLGQAAIAGVSAVALGRLFDGLSFPLAVLASAAAAVVAGVIMGAPALRVRGAQLAVVTLAAAVAVEALLLRNAAANAGDLKPPKLFGLDLALQRGTELARLPFAYAVLVVLVLCCLLVSRLISGTTGRRLLAVRSNERAAASVGIDVARSKLLAFAVSSFLAGIGGALLAYSRGAVSVESFNYFAGVTFLIYAFIGGIVSVSGALVAGLLAPFGLIYVVANGIIDLGSSYAILGGVGMILAAITTPQGAAGAWGQALRRLLRRKADVVVGPTVAAPADRPPVRKALGPEVLRLTGVNVTYGGVHAVADVSLAIRAGEVHGLIGPNGAGKTSTLDAITGFCAATGSVVVQGKDVQGLAPHRRFAAGLTRTWQSTELFLDLSVMDNLLVAADVPQPGDLLRDIVGRPRITGDDALWALRLLQIEHLANARPDTLSTGQQKLVGVARALAARPAVLLCDEPAAGLDSAESRDLGRHLRAVADSGVAIVLIEHDLSLVLEISDRVTVLDFGRVIAQGTPAEVSGDPAVLAAYVGESPAPDEEHDPAIVAGALLAGGAS
ncbi:MAG: putative transporter, ATP-binding/permease protein [Frankiales bacterium]|nr:putative transporter, ATP-binding/permease protein [Frankiales bacterium]